MFRSMLFAAALFSFFSICTSKEVDKQPIQLNAADMVPIEERLEKVGVHGEKKKDGTWEVRFEDELPIGDDVVVAAMGTKEKPGPLRELRVTTLNLWNSEVTAKGIRLIAELSAVEELILSGTHVDEEGMKAIAKMPKLKALMPGINVKSEALVHLANHPSIEWLDVQTCIVEDKAIDALVTIKGLRNLDLSNQRWLKRDSYAKLRQLKALKTLHVRSAGLRDEDLVAFSGITSLKVLDLDFNDKLTGSGFEQITGLDALEFLTIYQVPFEGANLKHLKKLPKLQKVLLYGREQRNQLADFLVLAGMPELREIVVGEARKDTVAEAKLAEAKVTVKYLGE